MFSHGYASMAVTYPTVQVALANFVII